MEIQRTANAGVLLKLDGVSILLDGLADRVEGYLPTPPEIAQQLLENPPDILAFTHYHADHCSEALLLPYRKQKFRPILGPEVLDTGAVQIKGVTITPIESRHLGLGRMEPKLRHVSYVIEGSQCVWFLGDATPVQWKNRQDLPRPDVLIAPYVFVNTKSVWDLTCKLADKVVVLHLPDRNADAYGLWRMVEQTTANESNVTLWIPEMGERMFV